MTGRGRGRPGAKATASSSRGGPKRGGRGNGPSSSTTARAVPNQRNPRGRGAPRGARGARGARGGQRGGARGAMPLQSGPPKPEFESISISVPFELMSPKQLIEKKTELLNMVAAAMLSEPKASASSPLFMKIMTTCKQVAYYDPEFLLKMALYVRQDLNIRSTANYLLAMSSNIRECQPYVSKYYEDTIRLPSDWLEVVSIYKTLPDRTVQDGIPTCLRKAMVEKFTAFDEYQLGKYNKERNLKRKTKKLKLRAEKMGVSVPRPERPGITLKQMIRQLHISVPPFAVMALLGKRYPVSLEEFRQADLPGNFDPNLAGTRIKLPVPETWETMLSEKGNKASTWEELIDHKKLPFMAMLRNLRNLITTGVSFKHHRWAQNKLSNEETIAQSRQFPFRFFSAYEVIPASKQALMDSMKPKESKDPSKPLRAKKNPVITKVVPTDQVLDAYRTALDQAVKHATTHNVDPIKGATVVFCNVSKETRSDAPGAKGLGGAVKQVAQLGYLLGLMCKYVCEECDFRIWSNPSRSNPSVYHLGVDLEDGTILANMNRVAQQATKLGEEGAPFPLEYIENLISTKKKIDNLLILSHKNLNPEDGGGEAGNLGLLLTKYRSEVNPDLLFVSVNLSSSGKPSIGSNQANPNNIMISGFSEQILRFIAERGGDGQLAYVEHIDDAKGINAKMAAKKKGFAVDPSPWWKWIDTLGDTMQDAPVYSNILASSISWRTIRVFISSTFLDMHGERDALTRLVFPELKERCKKKRIEIVEVDLRWGITEEQSQHALSIDLCMNEVQRADFFIGILGERYGWAPSHYEIPKTSANAQWISTMPGGKSITELEMEVAGLSKASTGCALTDTHPTQSFFYLRDKAFIETIPDEHKKNFEAESAQAKEKMVKLKTRIVNSGLPVRKKYPASWRGFEDGKPMTGNLSAFCDMVFDDLWNAIESTFPNSEADAKPWDSEVFNQVTNSPSISSESSTLADDKQSNNSVTVSDALFNALMEQRLEQSELAQASTKHFFGRKEQLDALHAFANPPPALSNYTPTQRSHMLVLQGSPGDGKTSLLSKFCLDLAEKDPHLFVVSHFCGASPAASNLFKMLTRLCWEIKAAFSLDDFEIPMDFKELQLAFANILKEASFKGRLIVILDAVDELQHDSESQAHALGWLPLELPCKFIISTTTSLAVEAHVAANSGFQYKTSISAAVDNTTHNQVLDTLRNRKIENMVEVRMSPLTVEERTHFIRAVLNEYHKKLDERPMNTQMRTLLRKTDCGKPIYIQVACEELRVFGVHEQVSEKIASLGSTTSKLFESVLQRLEIDHSASVIESLFVALLASRGGLNELEIAAATELDSNSKEFQRLMRSVIPYLRINSQYMSIFHEQLAIAASKRYIRKVSKLTQTIHSKIAKYLYNLADPSRQGSFIWNNASPRVLSELPYHLLGAGMFSDLETVLTDLVFIECKARAQLTFDLINDYSSTLASLSLDNQKKVAAMQAQLKDYISFAKQNAFILHSNPSLTVQQASNEPDSSIVAKKASSLWISSTDRCKNWFEWLNKPQAQAACKMTYNAMGEAMLCTAVSPDGAILAMAGKECVIRLYNARTGAELGSISPSQNGHSQWIVALNFSNDSRFLVSSSWDNTAKVWDVPTRTMLFNLSKGHQRKVNDACFSPSGRYVATACWDNNVRVYDTMQNGDLIKTIQVHGRPVNCVCFSPDEKYVISGSWDSTIVMTEANLDVSTVPKVFKKFTGHQGSITSVAMSPNGLAIASTSRDQKVNLWDAISGKLISSLDCHRKPVLSLKYSWDGQFLATTSSDCTVRVFKSTLGAELAVVKAPEGIYMTSVVAHPKLPNLFAVGTSDCNIMIYDVARSKFVFTFERKHNRPINALDWSPCGKYIASCAEEPTVLIWNGETYHFIGNGATHLHPVNCVAFNPVSNLSILASGCDGFDVRLWNYKTNSPFVPLNADTSKQALGVDGSILKGHTSTVKALSWHPKGRMLSSGSRDRTIISWDVTTGLPNKTLRGHKDWLNSVCFSPDGQKIASGAWDYHIKIWNMRQDEPVDPAPMTGHDGPVLQVRYINDGNHLVSASSDGKLVVWDATSGTIITTLNGHSSRINAISVMNDGSSIISVSDDSTIRIWSPLEPIEIAVLTGHANTIRSVSFAPSSDNYLIYTASDDKTVKVWDAGVSKHSTSSSEDSFGSSRNQQEHHHHVQVLSKSNIELNAHESQINCIDSKTTEVLASCDAGMTCHYDIETGSSLRVYIHPESRSMRACAFGKQDSDSLVFTACDGGMLWAWDSRAESTTSPQLQFTSQKNKAHAGPITSISLNNEYMVSGGWDNTCYLWDLKKTNQPLSSFTSNDWILSTKISQEPSSSKYLLFAGWDGQLTSVANGSTTFSTSVDQDLAMKEVYTDCSFFNLNGIRYAAVSSLQGSVRFSNVSSTKSQMPVHDMKLKGLPRINKIATSAAYLAPSSNRNVQLFTAGEDCILRQFSISNANNAPKLRGIFPAKAPLTSIATIGNDIWIGDRIGNLYFLQTRDESNPTFSSGVIAKGQAN